MAYTTEDLEKVKDAIIKLAEGKRVVSYTIAGRSLQYSQAQLNELLSLRDIIQAEITSQTSTQRHFFLAQSSKGL